MSSNTATVVSEPETIRRAVLLIDSDMESRGRFTRLLAGSCDVIWTANTADAIRHAVRTPPDVILCHSNAPGTDVLRGLAEIPAFAHVAVVLLDEYTAGPGAALMPAAADLPARIEYELGRRQADIGATLRWREIAEEVGHFVWTHDAGGQIDWANRRWYEFTRLPREIATTAEGWSLIMPPEDMARVVPQLQAALRDGRPHEAEHRLKPCGGLDSEYRWMASRCVPVAAADGSVVRWIGTMVDIHERKSAAIEREQHLARLAEALPQMVWQASADGSNEYFSERWFAFTGFTPAQTRGFGWLEALHREDVATTLTAWNRALRLGCTFEAEYRIRRGAGGAHRWFFSRGAPVRADDGNITCWLGTCTDIDDRRRIETVQRFSLEASAELGHSPNVVQTCRLVADRAVDLVADACVFHLVRPNGTLERVAWAHRDPERRAGMAECVNYALQPAADSRGPSARAFVRNEVVFVRCWDAAHSRRAASSDDHFAFLDWLQISSLISVPLVGAQETLGVLTLCRTNPGEHYAEAELGAFRDVGRRVGLALESARISERNRTVVDRFQRAALPKSLPVLPGIAFDAVYEPAGGPVEVGGDWYDAFVIGDGGLILSIGDVTGHGLEAAITMNAVRQSIRTAALYDPDPATILRVVNTALRAESPDRFVTAFVAHLAPETGRLVYACAGHPPPFVRRCNAEVELLERTALMLGFDDIVLEGPAKREMRLSAGDMLVLYTDGLIEAGHDIQASLTTMASVLGEQSVALSSSPAALVRDAVLVGASHDDVAIMVVTLERDSRWTFDALDASAAQGARVGFARYLRRSCSADSDILGAETIFGELVSNVVRYAPGPIEIDLEWGEQGATLHVFDHGPGFVWNRAHLPDDFAERGRGLFIVAALATHLAVRPRPGRGSHVAAELPVTRFTNVT